MEKLISVVIKTPNTRAQNDDDFADRLSSRYTVVQLIAFAILIGMTQYVRTPITCWVPVHFTSSQVKFANNYCWVKNTYQLPWHQRVPDAWNGTQQQFISYYQWIPFILLAQAALFFVPSVVWHGLNSKAGVDADNILKVASTLSYVDKNHINEQALRLVCSQIDRFLRSRFRRRKNRHPCKFIFDSSRYCGRRCSSYLLVLFLITKVLYIGNAVGQLFLLNWILSAKYVSFGYDIVRQMVEDVDWTEESFVAFPRVTLCDFKVRGQDMAHTHSYTVQCVLPINIYNEKIYLYLWFWMLFVAGYSTINLLLWIIRSVISIDRYRFVKNHLSEVNDKYRRHENKLNDDNYEQDKKKHDDNYGRGQNEYDRYKEFTDSYLKSDGVFLLRLIAHNTDGITTTDIASTLYDKWSSIENTDNNRADDEITEVTWGDICSPLCCKSQR